MITLKRTDSDNKDFHQLVEKLDKDLWARYGTVQNEYSRYNKIENNNTVIVAYADSKPVGCGCFKKFDDSSAEIKRMYVEVSHRGKGIGASILSKLENWAKENGFDSTVLETASGQPEAIHLYIKQGYKAIPNYGQYVNMEMSICMKKSLI